MALQLLSAVYGFAVAECSMWLWSYVALQLLSAVYGFVVAECSCVALQVLHLGSTIEQLQLRLKSVTHSERNLLAQVQTAKSTDWATTDRMAQQQVTTTDDFSFQQSLTTGVTPRCHTCPNWRHSLNKWKRSVP